MRPVGETRVGEWMKARLERWETTRGQARLELHLARMQARERWQQLRPQRTAVRHLAHEVARVTRTTAGELRHGWRRYREALHR